MNVSQVLHHINENNYDDDITVTDVPDNNFLAVTANDYDPGTTIRILRVEILPLEGSHGGTQTVNSGLFVRQEDESAVTAQVFQDGKELSQNTQNYS